MFSGFQPNAFQNNAFQIVLSARELNGWMGGPKDSYSYASPWDKLKEQKLQEAKIEAARLELQKLDEALKAKELAQAEALLKARQELEDLQSELISQQLLDEINRLRIERALLVQRINAEETLLILMIATRRRRLRAF